jgi:hypothetical protein
MCPTYMAPELLYIAVAGVKTQSRLGPTRPSASPVRCCRRLQGPEGIEKHLFLQSQLQSRSARARSISPPLQ